jgi:DNA adenine methylase
VEPFVGGANMIDKVNGKRIGADINPYLIEALIMIRDNPESIPDLITEDDYNKYKKELKIDGLTGFTGFAMSFGAK